ncbi:TRAFAC clade GTPase domain-containing protein [Paractinoplanes lichenicola]|uniref:Double-GTPase 2 domain-containing protein n=1 Tax=Paractinoplanes lichenicola TaxID=2802976 RepID=A0ABS1VU73_9ACTN|nr:hypothetical protein [Actinoplanes lichenicola]MBL7258037.1 hypothetical protein [Actinoplanes lichenicola]
MSGRGPGWWIGTAIYLTVCLACVVFVSVPLLLLSLGVGLVAGALTVVALAGVVLAGGEGTAVLHTPAEVRESRLLPTRVREAFVRRDRAWPQYFAAQSRLDIQAIVDRARLAHDRMWAGPLPWLREKQLLAWWPLIIPLAGGQGAVTAGGALAVAATTVVLALVTGAAWLVGLPVVYLLRGADAAWQRVRGARASCAKCFELTAVPAYRCRGPHELDDRLSGDDLHRDIRPGLLGVWWRRCACGTKLPTMVLRAAFSRRLQPCCPSCGEPLFRGAGVVTDVRIPVFGAASAGKTQLIMAALVGLERAAATGGAGWQLLDERSKRTFAEYTDLVLRGADPAQTDASGPPVALTVRLDKGSRPALVHVFDAAGESLLDPEQNSRLSYLDYARSLIFVMDPFSVRRIADEFSSVAPDVYAAANPARHDPERSYNATVTRLRDFGVRTDRQRLAFVVTKADLLDKLGAGPHGGDLRDWLAAIGLGNLLLAVERDFGEVEFFLVCGRDPGPDAAPAPLRWVLSKEWMSLD